MSFITQRNNPNSDRKTFSTIEDLSMRAKIGMGWEGGGVGMAVGGWGICRGGFMEMGEGVG